MDRFFRDLEKPKYPHLVRPGGGLSGEMYDMRDDISRAFDRVDLGCASSTEGVTHYYADADNGDDGNDGSSWAQAKRTLTGVIEVLPDFIAHLTFVNLRGTFSNQGNVRALVRVYGNSALVFDGGLDVNILAGPWTADISSTSSIGLSTLSLTPDQYAGKDIQILTGPQAGATHMIHGHDATTLTPMVNFGSDPGTVSFQITEPKTAIEGNSGASTIFQTGVSNFCIIQRIRFIGTDIDVYVKGLFTLGDVHFNGTSGSRFQFSSAAGVTDIGIYDPEIEAYSTINRGGFSCSDKKVYVSGFNSIGGTAFFTAYLGAGLEVTQSDANLSYAVRAKGILLDGVGMGNALPIKNVSGYAGVHIDGASGSGLILRNANVQINDGVIIEGNGAHGIEVNNSYVKLGAVAGTGNAGAGVYAHSGSIVHTTDGTPPTITGTVGDLAISSETSEESTWSNLDSVGKIAIADEFTIAKKV